MDLRVVRSFYQTFIVCLLWGGVRDDWALLLKV